MTKNISREIFHSSFNNQKDYSDHKKIVESRSGKLKVIAIGEATKGKVCSLSHQLFSIKKLIKKETE